MEIKWDVGTTNRTYCRYVFIKIIKMAQQYIKLAKLHPLLFDIGFSTNQNAFKVKCVRDVIGTIFQIMIILI